MQFVCYVSSCQHLADSSSAFWNFLKFFFPQSILHQRLVESADVEPMDTKGWLYSIL